MIGEGASTAVVNRLGDTRLLVVGLVLLTARVVLEPVPSLVPSLVGFFLFGTSLPSLQVAAATMLQHRTPNAVMGRAAAALEVVQSVPYTVAIGLGAAIVGIVAHRVVFAVVAAVLAVAALYALVAIAPRPVSRAESRDPASSLQ